MSATTPMNWSVRPWRRARLFRSLLIVCAGLAVGYSCWPLLDGQPLAQALTVLIVLLVFARAYAPDPRSGFAHDSGRHCLSRIAAGHWRITTAPDLIVDGSLHHVWRGWGWMTLRIRPFDGSRSLTHTVWRAHVSDADWHQLRVWTAWEIAMVSSPEVCP